MLSNNLLGIAIRKHFVPFPLFARFCSTVDDGKDGLQNGHAEELKTTVKIVSKLRKIPKSTLHRVSAIENLQSENIRKKSLETKQKKDWKIPKPSEVTTEEVLSAVNSVIEDLHKNDIANQKKTKSELVEKLMEYEKENFEAATSAQYGEMLSDKVFASFLASVKEETIRPPPRAIEMRRIRRGMLLLKREIFYQALQSGHKAENAREIAERAVKIAEQRAVKKHEILVENYTEEQKEKMLKEVEQTKKENEFYDVALQLASKMLYPKDLSSYVPDVSSFNIIHPSLNVQNIFDDKTDRLDVFDSAKKLELKNHSLKQWCDWDRNAAKIWNQSFGPTNAFEEMIELTEEGKMWPYPVNNEYQIGSEENVGFYEHIFLDKYLLQYDLPKEGPVAQFMELVCVGLSKNPFMFANYFKEKAEEIKRMQEDMGVAVDGSI
ncbi:unnamed protein product [Thelazia callipaeda]|uniref:Small ribosomal subunit protein mS31 n=1 Tax=Thelazia callipaeda TaxID=103827 RepID=A0A0N5D8S5_THECL|nr:unnamed protein product [Thelazia callipaeda]